MPDNNEKGNLFQRIILVNHYTTILFSFSLAAITGLVIFCFSLYYGNRPCPLWTRVFLILAVVAFIISFIFALKQKGLLLNETTPVRKLEYDFKQHYILLYNSALLFIAGVLFFILALLALFRSSSGDDGKLVLDIVQINDVYNINALDGGRIGGMARAATLKKEILQQNPNTLMVMAGDFLSPSVYNTVKYKNELVMGRQMVEMMNAAGMDIAIFGNHEFDLKTDTLLQKCIDESGFDWVASNAFHIPAAGAARESFKRNDKDILPYIIRDFTDADGTKVKVGFMGLTIPDNKPRYVDYDSVLNAAEKIYKKIKNSCDAVIAITHQSMQEDVALARRLPELALIIGGHEHDMQFGKIGNVCITKAHSNAKSAFVIRLEISKHKVVSVRPEMRWLDSTIAFDPLSSAIAEKWTKRAYDFFIDSGYSPRDTIVKAGSGNDFDARDESVRKGSTNFTDIIAAAMKGFCDTAAKETVSLAFYNAGSIRVDEIMKLPLTQFSILEAMPYPGLIRMIKIRGDTLIQLLNSRKVNEEEGAFLQFSPFVKYDARQKKWMIGNTIIDDTAHYKAAVNDFLLSGKEKKLPALDSVNGSISIIDRSIRLYSHPGNELRRVIIKQLRGAAKDKPGK